MTQETPQPEATQPVAAPAEPITLATPPPKKAAPVWPMLVACLAVGAVVGFAAHTALIPSGARRPATPGRAAGRQRTAMPGGEGQGGGGRLSDAPAGARVGQAVLAKQPGVALGRLVLLLAMMDQLQGKGLTPDQKAAVKVQLRDLDMGTQLTQEEAGKRVRALADLLTPQQKAALAAVMPPRGRATEVPNRPFLTARNVRALDYLVGRPARQIADEPRPSFEQQLSAPGAGQRMGFGRNDGTQDR